MFSVKNIIRAMLVVLVGIQAPIAWAGTLVFNALPFPGSNVTGLINWTELSNPSVVAPNEITSWTFSQTSGPGGAWTIHSGGPSSSIEFVNVLNGIAVVGENAGVVSYSILPDDVANAWIHLSGLDALGVAHDIQITTGYDYTYFVHGAALWVSPTGYPPVISSDPVGFVHLGSFTCSCADPRHCAFVSDRSFSRFDEILEKIFFIKVSPVGQPE